MGCEIERKFLLDSDSWRLAAEPGVRMIQGYFARSGTETVRVRIACSAAFLTIKGARSGAFRRSEFEYPVPVADAELLLAEFCGDRLVEKIRYPVPFGAHRWEVDAYLGRNQGLFTAEIELASESESFAVPPWLGREVSADGRYANGALAVNPYRKTWDL